MLSNTFASPSCHSENAYAIASIYHDHFYNDIQLFPKAQRRELFSRLCLSKHSFNKNDESEHIPYEGRIILDSSAPPFLIAAEFGEADHV